LTHCELDLFVRSVAEAAPAPAVAISVFTPAGPLAEYASGIANIDTGQRADIDRSYWDLASLTKVLVTLPEVLSLVDAGAFNLDSRFGSVWPVAEGTVLGSASIRQMLSYSAGLPRSARLFQQATGRAEILAAALRVPAERAVGASGLYNDVNFMMLGAMVVDLTGRSLGDLARRRSSLVFDPPQRWCVATERCAWRGRLIVGEAHDENVAAMGGESGHAGAFGTLRQVREMARRWLTADIVSTASHTAARTCWATNADGDRYGLGWWLPPTRGIGGTLGTPTGYGMSGFVGNRIWLEPDHGYGVVVLSNRIHPVRVDGAPFKAWAAKLLDGVARIMLPATE
jgi:CubicO group peptidase (beta-lactamase class C family)